MSSVSGDDEKAPDDQNNSNDFFVNAISENKVILEKSKLPEITAKKKGAIKNISESYEKHFGATITEKQILKKITNLKSRLLKKTSLKLTGNKKIVLKEWEQKLINLLDVNKDNPSINKISGNLFSFIGKYFKL